MKNEKNWCYQNFASSLPAQLAELGDLGPVEKVKLCAYGGNFQRRSLFAGVFISLSSKGTRELKTRVVSSVWGSKYLKDALNMGSSSASKPVTNTFSVLRNNSTFS